MNEYITFLISFMIYFCITDLICLITNFFLVYLFDLSGQYIFLCIGLLVRSVYEDTHKCLINEADPEYICFTEWMHLYNVSLLIDNEWS
jgi:hypothetical protein